MAVKTALVFVTLILLAIGCQSPVVKGSGRLVTQDREISCFSSVIVSGAGNLYLIEGDEPALSVQAEENLIDLLATEVTDGVLKLFPRAADKSVHISPTKPINYYLTSPCLSKITINGEGEVYSQGRLTTDWLRVTVNGGGELNLELNVDRLTVHIAGSGYAKLSGRADQQTLLISGSGELHADHLVSKAADVKISGSGNVWLNVSQTLDVRVSGSGEVRYRGDASVTQTISGSGRVLKTD